MIRGVGVDIAPIDRMREALERHEGRLEARLFTDGERAYCRGKALKEQHFAARFAAKEAFVKALGVPLGLGWHEVEVISGERGAPRLSLSGKAAVAAHTAGVVHLHLSLSHAGGHAVAVVIAEG